MTESVSALNIPGPPPMRLFGWRGNVWSIMANPLAQLEEMRKRYGDIVTVVGGGVAGSSTTIFAFGAANNRQVLSSPGQFRSIPLMRGLTASDSLSARQAAAKRLGTGLFGIDGARHKSQRGLAMIGLRPSRLTNFLDCITNLTAERLSAWIIGETLKIDQEMKILSLNVFGKALFNLDMKDSAAELATNLFEWLRAPCLPEMIFFQYDAPCMPYKRFLDLSMSFDRYLRDLIDQESKCPQDRSLLSTLIQSFQSGELTEDELIGNAMLVFTGGLPTTSMVLTWALLLLSQHPKVYAELFAELDSTLHGRPALSEDSLPLLDAVLKETMRILPAVPVVSRMAAEPVELGGYQLEPGLDVILSIYHTHTDASIYDSPKRFAPERWQTISPSSFEYLPFSAGAHNCVGGQFGWQFTRVVLSMIVQRYRLECVPGSRIDPCAYTVLMPKNSIFMTVRALDGKGPAVGRLTGRIREMVQLPD